MSEHPDEEPISEEEEAWGRGYWAMLAYGEPEPDAAHLRPDRVARIKQALDERWRSNVRRITRRRR